MRKIFLLCGIFLPTLSFAAPSLGPDMPSRHHFSVGVQNYTVFKRTLEDGHGKIHSLQDFLLISYGITDWLSLDLKGGSGNIRLRSHDPAINYPTFLAGGYGFRLRLYEHNNTKVIFGFQHISVHPFRVSVNGIKNKAVLDDWQFPVIVSHRFKYITPYAGARWSWMNQIHWTDHVRKLEKSKGTGMVVGVDIPLNKRTWCNVEGQFFDAAALAVSINFDF